MLFCSGSVVALAAWLSWSIAYALVAPVYGDEWYDTSLCAGLVGVPTALLVVIFLPKVSRKCNEENNNRFGKQIMPTIHTYQYCSD